MVETTGITYFPLSLFLLILSPFRVFRVQQMVRFLSQGFFQELLVDFGNRRVFMGFAIFEIFILLVKSLRTKTAYFIVYRDGLSATGDAATRAGHDFDEMI